MRRPDRRVDVGCVWALRIVEILGEPAFPRSVLTRNDSGDDRNRQFLQKRKVVGSPGHDFANDADDQRGGRDGQPRIRREVDRHFDSISAWTNANSRRATVRRDDHHRHGKDVRQQERELLNVAIRVLLRFRDLKGDVVVRAVSLEPHRVFGAFSPGRQLIAHESDLFPKIPDHSCGAVRSELDDRSDDFDHAAVEVDGTSCRKLEGRFFPRQERTIDERGGTPPILLGVDFHLVQPDVELRFHTDDRHLEPGPLRDPFISDLVFPIPRHVGRRPGQGWTAANRTAELT